MAQAKKSTKMERNKCGHLTARSRGWASPRAYYKKDGPGILARPCGQGEPGVAADVSKSLRGGRSTACFAKSAKRVLERSPCRDIATADDDPKKADKTCKLHQSMQTTPKQPNCFRPSNTYHQSTKSSSSHQSTNSVHRKPTDHNRTTNHPNPSQT